MAFHGVSPWLDLVLVNPDFYTLIIIITGLPANARYLLGMS